MTALYDALLQQRKAPYLPVEVAVVAVAAGHLAAVPPCYLLLLLPLLLDAPERSQRTL